MTPHESLEERVGNLERGLAVIVATKGTLRLCTAHVMLVWTVLAAIAGVGVLVLQTSWNQAQQGAAIVSIATKVDTHIAAPGHAISLERLMQMQNTLNEVKSLVQMHMERR
jgi:hypothetical protein